MATAMPEDELNDTRPPLWKKLDHIESVHAVTSEKIKMLEDSFMRHMDFHDGMGKSLESIKLKLQENGEVLISLKLKLDENRKEIDSLWAFPLKLAGVIVALGGAGTVTYKLIKWLLTSADIRIVR